MYVADCSFSDTFEMATTTQASPSSAHRRKKKSKRRKQDRRLSVFEKSLLEHTLDPLKDLACALMGAEKAARFRKWSTAHLGVFVVLWFVGTVFNIASWFKSMLSR